jgi:hypothetical protein
MGEKDETEHILRARFLMCERERPPTPLAVKAYRRCIASLFACFAESH